MYLTRRYMTLFLLSSDRQRTAARFAISMSELYYTAFVTAIPPRSRSDASSLFRSITRYSRKQVVLG